MSIYVVMFYTCSFRSKSNAAGTILSTDLTSRPPAYSSHQGAKVTERSVKYVKDPDLTSNDNPSYSTLVTTSAGGVAITDEYLHPVGREAGVAAGGEWRVSDTYMSIDEALESGKIGADTPTPDISC